MADICGTCHGTGQRKVMDGRFSIFWKLVRACSHNPRTVPSHALFLGYGL
jgi:hypothetical protein